MNKLNDASEQAALLGVPDVSAPFGQDKFQAMIHEAAMNMLDGNVHPGLAQEQRRQHAALKELHLTQRLKVLGFPETAKKLKDIVRFDQMISGQLAQLDNITPDQDCSATDKLRSRFKEPI